MHLLSKTYKTTNKMMNYPKKAAYGLAQQMKKFRAQTEETIYSENNYNANNDRAEVVRQIDWAAFNTLVEQLEFTYLMDKKYKNYLT